MNGEWSRGYGQRYKHLVIRTEITKYFKRTHFACGQNTEYIVDELADRKLSHKCPTCISYERQKK